MGIIILIIIIIIIFVVLVSDNKGLVLGAIFAIICAIAQFLIPIAVLAWFISIFIN